MTQQQIGLVGLGMMGHGIARNLLAKGFGLRFKAHRSRDTLADLLAAGAQELDTHAALARECDAVIVCVTGSPQVEEVVYGRGGLLEGARPGLRIIDCSTAEPASTARLRADLAARGAKLIDAPLARTPKEAEEGRLNTMVGAEAEDFAAIEPVLRAFCENIFHVGPPGHGHVLKLVNNMMAMSFACAIAEAFAVAAKSGLDLNKLYDVVSVGGVNCGIFQMMATRTLKEGALDGFKFGIGNARKDLRYYAHLAETLPVASPIGAATHQALVQAVNLGFGEHLIASLFEAQEQLNDVRIVPRA
ncbi:NAD(P)-dependent oxidoreductase [Aquincola sp. S2]|uniref:NAD(P)-dependent oxidoreductase n=1 Tax=Pseudaquabacterium terrae TaxID=2732868 RepID=A0ABX2EQB2_9BURK|nr:NAD(P)-dependent oxidoreductase [Aquabacterium terrae]NRF70864.1 NAD(P)-dependent oxidoreductase [Aquabacterium terrae]